MFEKSSPLTETAAANRNCAKQITGNPPCCKKPISQQDGNKDKEKKIENSKRTPCSKMYTFSY